MLTFSLAFVLCIGCVLFNCSAKVSRALRTGSPAESEDVVDDGGAVSIDIISSAACLR